MDELLLDKSKTNIFKNISYNDFLGNVGYLQSKLKDKDNNILIILPNSDKLIILLIACILLNKKIYYIDPLKPKNINYINKFNTIYTTTNFYRNNKKNIDKICNDIICIDNYKIRSSGIINNYKKLDLNIVYNDRIINIDFNFLKNQFSIIKKVFTKKRYVFVYNILDIDIISIFFYTLLYKKGLIIFYKNGNKKRDIYFIRDYDNLNYKNNIIILKKSQRLINHNINNYLIFDNYKYRSILYKNNQFIYNKHLLGFYKNNQKWIKLVNNKIERATTYLEDYYLSNPIYIKRHYSHNKYNDIIECIYNIPFISMKYIDHHIYSVDTKNIINPNESQRLIYPFFLLIDKNNITIYGNIYYNSIFSYFINLIDRKNKGYLVYKLDSKKNKIVTLLIIFIVFIIRKFKPINDITEYSEYTIEIEKDNNDNEKDNNDNEKDNNEKDDNDNDNEKDNNEKDNNENIDIDSFILNKIIQNRENLDGFYLLKYNYCLLPKNSNNIREIINLDDFFYYINKLNMDYILDGLFIGIFYVGDNNNFDYNIINTKYRMVIIVSENKNKCNFKFYYQKKDEYFINHFK